MLRTCYEETGVMDFDLKQTEKRLTQTVWRIIRPLSVSLTSDVGHVIRLSRCPAQAPARHIQHDTVRGTMAVPKGARLWSQQAPQCPIIYSSLFFICRRPADSVQV